jgi:hypothetical protein
MITSPDLVGTSAKTLIPSLEFVSSSNTFCNLPQDILATILQFCNIETLCTLSCTSKSQFNRTFFKNVKLTLEASQRVFDDEAFREKIRARVLFPIHKIHISKYVKKITEGTLVTLMCIENFTHLNLRIGDLSAGLPLPDLINLKLDISYTQVRDISVLTSLKNLKGLDISHTKISNISGLAALTELTELDLSHIRASNISPISGLKNLMELNLSYTEVLDISALAGLKNLTKLSLRKTNVSNISVLSRLTNLTKIDLFITKVFDISSLSGLRRLTELDLVRTQVSDVTHLSGLTK